MIEAIAETESGMNAKALNYNTNGSFDMGLMQVNSFWLRTLDLERDKLMDDPCYNVLVGARILRQCVDRHGYNWEAVGCYNATSTKKRIGYSWKIYDALAKKPKESPSLSVAQQKSAPFLAFEVHDITEQRGSTKP